MTRQGVSTGGAGPSCATGALCAAAICILLPVGAANAGADHIVYPEGYQSDFTYYNTVNLADERKQVVKMFANDVALQSAKDGAPQDATHYKANVDVLMAVDVMVLCEAMKPDVVVMVTGDADFAPLALHLRRQGIRVEVAAMASTMGAGLRGAANEVVDLTPLFESFEALKGREE